MCLCAFTFKHYEDKIKILKSGNMLKGTCIKADFSWETMEY